MTQKPIYLLCTVLLYFVGIFFFPSFFFLLKNFPCTTLHALRRACSSSYSSSFLNSPKNMACSTCNAIYRLPKELLYQHHQKEKWWAETPKTLGLFFSHHSHKWRRLYYLFCRPSSQRLAIYPSFPSADIVYSSSKCLNCSSLNAGDVVPFSLLLQQLPPSPFFVKTRWGSVTYSM